MKTVKRKTKIQDEIISAAKKQSLNCSDSLFCQKTYKKLLCASFTLLLQYLQFWAGYFSNVELDASVVEKNILLLKKKAKANRKRETAWDYCQIV